MNTALDEVVERFEPSPQLVSVMAGAKTNAVLALDIGTSGVRASLFDQQGNEIEDATVRLPQPRSGIEDLAVIEAEATFDLIAQTIDALLAQPLQAGIQIQQIAISCFWHSLVGVDENGSAMTPVFGWADRRAASVVKELQSRFDEAEIHARTGCRFHPSYWPAKLLFLRAEQPAIFRRTRYWLSFGEYVVLRLCGETAASVSMASGTGLFNLRLLDWDRELIETLDISLETLPDVSHQNQTFHTMTPEHVRRWPQLSDARLLPPIGDGAANTIGSGCTTKERTALMIGTSGAMRVLFEGDPPPSLPSALWCYRADRRRVVVGGALSDGGGLYRWLRESLLPTEDTETIETALEAMEPDAHGLTVLPFWAGERSTGWSMKAQGTILGLSLQTQPIDILRAAMEAVAYRFALIANALESVAPGASIIASGTALSSSPVWTQMIADVIGRAVMLSDVREASARGAALLALEAAGRIETIEAFPVCGRTFEPHISRHARYQQGLERQKRTYETLFENDCEDNL